MSKYHARKTVTSDGIVHDSAKEADRWCELKLLERNRIITKLDRQVKFVLIPAQYETYERYSKNGARLKDGKRMIEKECAYLADFVYHFVDTDVMVVEDVKGFKTKEYRIKKKLMLWVHGIQIREI